MRTNRITTTPKDPVPAKNDRAAWLKGGNHRCSLPPHSATDRAWRIVLLGAPGVGKGTQADRLCERLDACHLSTGDVFRAAKCACESELSAAMQNAIEYMKRGELVPDETVLNMVGERLHCLQCSGGFLLDGFPRTVAQAKALEQFLESQDLQLTAVFDYELPIEKIITRISGRRTCSNCKVAYHLTDRPPTIAGLCDNCGGKLFQRDDDRPEAVKARMEVYQSSTKPLINFYQRRKLLVTISAEGSPEETYQRTLQATQTL